MTPREYQYYDFTPLLDLDLDRLPTIWKELIESKQEASNTPLNMSLPAVLAYSNLAILDKYDVDCHLFTCSSSLFIMITAPSGAHKSSISKGLQEGFDRRIREVSINQRDAIARYKLKKKKYDNDLKTINVETDDLPNEPIPPEEPNMIVGTGTLNGIMGVLDTRGHIGLFTSEGGEFLKGHSMKSSKTKDDGKDKELVSYLAKMFDGANHIKVTGVEFKPQFNRRMGIMIMVQDEMARDFLSNTDFAAQGILPRFLISQCEDFNKREWWDTPESRKAIERERQANHDFAERVYQLLSQGSPYVDPIRAPFELSPAIMGSTDEARTLMQHYYNATVYRKQSDLADYKTFANRVYEHMCRIATTIAAFELRDEIEPSDVEAAIMITEWFIRQRLAMEVQAVAQRPELYSVARQVIRWMERRQWAGTHNELRRAGPAGLNRMDSEQVAGIVREMVTTGEVEVVEAKGKNNRRINLIRLVDEKNTSVEVATDEDSTLEESVVS
jgi:hypothetical protein